MAATRAMDCSTSIIIIIILRHELSRRRVLDTINVVGLHVHMHILSSRLIDFMSIFDCHRGVNPQSYFIIDIASLLKSKHSMHRTDLETFTL